MTEIAVEGKWIRVPAIEIDDVTWIVRGGWLKIASLKDEEFLDGDPVIDPEAVLRRLRATTLKPDIFTFMQKIPDVIPRYSYYKEWESFAAIPISTYSDWLENRVTYDVRKAIKRAQKAGIETRRVEFNDELVQGISGIYNECPVRQGRPFWHYRKDFEAVRREHSTFPGRCFFIGSYGDGELLGFIRMIYVKSYAASMQVLSQVRHRREKTSNALIAKAVEICEQEGLSHFVYGRYIYNNPASSLTEFKRRNGFVPILVPRYYVPVTTKGAIALKLRLHRKLINQIPMSWRPMLYRVRDLLTAQKP